MTNLRSFVVLLVLQFTALPGLTQTSGDRQADFNAEMANAQIWIDQARPVLDAGLDILTPFERADEILRRKQNGRATEGDVDKELDAIAVEVNDLYSGILLQIDNLVIPEGMTMEQVDGLGMTPDQMRSYALHLYEIANTMLDWYRRAVSGDVEQSQAMARASLERLDGMVTFLNEDLLQSIGSLQRDNHPQGAVIECMINANEQVLRVKRLEYQFNWELESVDWDEQLAEFRSAIFKHKSCVVKGETHQLQTTIMLRAARKKATGDDKAILVFAEKVIGDYDAAWELERKLISAMERFVTMVNIESRSSTSVTVASDLYVARNETLEAERFRLIEDRVKSFQTQ